jgi:hypothetical protein
MPTSEPRVIVQPAILGRAGGLVMLHYGVIDGPQGVVLMVDVMTEDGSNVMAADGWDRRPLSEQLVEITGSHHDQPDHAITPKKIFSSTSKRHHRTAATFGAAGTPQWLDITAARITVTARPVDLTAVIELRFTGDGVTADA